MTTRSCRLNFREPTPRTIHHITLPSCTSPKSAADVVGRQCHRPWRQNRVDPERPTCDSVRLPLFQNY
jgi:hypothetical protein